MQAIRAAPVALQGQLMTTLTVQLPADLYQRLRAEAVRAGRPVEDLVEVWLTERLTLPETERGRAIEALRAAGLLAEPSAEMRTRAAQATMSLAEVRAALDRVGGTPLSEMIIEQRGPKA
jgi:plasmid stability protein